jgi:hypothetical protein
MNWEQVHKRAKEFTGKDEKMDKRLMQAACRTWDVIGGDCLVNNMGEPDESMTLPRSHVIEIVGDADYMLMYGDDNEAYAYFIYLRESNQSKHRDKIMKQAFPCKRYGW